MSLNAKICFFGDYAHNLDDKGRVALPSGFRDELGRSERPDLLWGLAYGGHLTLYTEEHWRKLMSDIETTIPDSDRRNMVLRALAVGGRALSLDKAGRILISTDQRTVAGLSREVKILGLGSKIQIWDKLAYERQELPDKAVLDEVYQTQGLNF